MTSEEKQYYEREAERRNETHDINEQNEQAEPKAFNVPKVDVPPQEHGTVPPHPQAYWVPEHGHYLPNAGQYVAHPHYGYPPPPPPPGYYHGSPTNHTGQQSGQHWSL